MKQFKILSALPLLFLSLFVNSQTAEKASSINNNSLLWKISGNGLSKPSYLFGTYHMLCKNQFIIKEKVKDALEKSDGIVAEVNFLDSTEMATMQKMMMGTKKLSETLNEVQKKEMEAALKLYGLSLQQADNFSLTLLYSLVALKAVDCPPADIKTIDIELMQIAKARGKTIGALETMAGQVQIMEKTYSLQDILKQMKNTDENKKVYAGLAAAYIAEDLVLLDELIKDPAFMTKDQEEYMLTLRNNTWVKSMPAMMKNNSLFFAVGAGHLWGDEGVITLLTNLGYTVQPVNQ